MTTTTSLFLDLILEIAACSDPATLVRCAAACKELRRHIADPAFRLRLRRSDRFVPNLLRGHLISVWVSGGLKLGLVDTSSPYATKLLSAAACFPPGPDGEPLAVDEVLASRDGLLLVRGRRTVASLPPRHELRVCSEAAGRSQALPASAPADFDDDNYVLLVGQGGGGGAVVGRPFQVLKARLVLSNDSVGNKIYSLGMTVFSSEQNKWRTYTKVPAPGIHGRVTSRQLVKPLVVGDSTVHWLCLTDTSSYILTLHVGVGTSHSHLTSTRLPSRIHRVCIEAGTGLERVVLASMSAGGRPVVLVADTEKILMWAQHEHSARWKERPQVVVEPEAVAQYTQTTDGLAGRWIGTPRLEWFAERSGVVLIRFQMSWSLFWLDLRTKEILRWFNFRRAAFSWGSSTVSIPYEKDLASWVPTLRTSL